MPGRVAVGCSPMGTRVSGCGTRVVTAAGSLVEQGRAGLGWTLQGHLAAFATSSAVTGSKRAEAVDWKPPHAAGDVARID